jgi:hypothetical protein
MPRSEGVSVAASDQSLPLRSNTSAQSPPGAPTTTVLPLMPTSAPRPVHLPLASMSFACSTQNEPSKKNTVALPDDSVSPAATTSPGAPMTTVTPSESMDAPKSRSPVTRSASWNGTSTGELERLPPGDAVCVCSA